MRDYGASFLVGVAEPSNLVTIEVISCTNRKVKMIVTMMDGREYELLVSEGDSVTFQTSTTILKPTKVR